MKGTKYLVSTTMGNTLLDQSISTYVKVAQRKYLEKRSADLKPGDLVLFAKPFTTTELEDVEPYLTRSPRYAKAKELLHETNANGQDIPVFSKAARNPPLLSGE